MEERSRPAGCIAFPLINQKNFIRVETLHRGCVDERDPNYGKAAIVD
jgi:hypothetical protein